MTFTLENVADVPIYNASLELLKEGKLNYIYQPREQLLVSTAALQPGEKLSHEYVLIPKISGVLILSKSFIVKTAGNTLIPGVITSHPAVITPQNAKRFASYRYGSGVGFSWEPGSRWAGLPDLQHPGRGHGLRSPALPDSGNGTRRTLLSLRTRVRQGPTGRPLRAELSGWTARPTWRIRSPGPAADRSTPW